MPTAEEQIIKQAAEDFEKQVHVKVKLLATVHRKERGDTIQIKRRANIYGDGLREAGWFMYDSQEKPSCGFVTKPTEPYHTFAVYEVENRRWEIRRFHVKKD